jgi:hypothetical protein
MYRGIDRTTSNCRKQRSQAAFSQTSVDSDKTVATVGRRFAKPGVDLPAISTIMQPVSASSPGPVGF